MAFNPSILKPEIQRFIHQDQHRDPYKIALSRSPFEEEGVSSAELAEQVDARQRCRNKLPTWYEKQGIYYPGKISIEQSSSESAARYKANILKEPATIADLTGGMGVDMYYLSQGKREAMHCEILPDLSDITSHNAKVFGLQNLAFHKGDGIEWLRKQHADQWEALYLDPARRSGDRKVYRLQDSYPNVVNYLDLLLEKSPLVLIKAAPMVDIHDSENQLTNIREVHVLSIQQECKEVLFLLDRRHRGAIKRIVTSLLPETSATLTFLPDDERNLVIQYSLPQKYLFEPDVALLKAGAFKTTSQHFNIKKIHPHTHLYTGPALVEAFMGKTVEIQKTTPYSLFKKTKKFEGGATVVTKNFPIKVDELRKKHKIGENPDQHLYFFTNLEGDLTVVQGLALRS